MNPIELDPIRRLIRANHGLPEPPRPRWAPAAEAAAPVAEPAGTAAPTLEPEPAGRPPTTACELIAEDESRDAATAEADAWRPDALVHRLVELLIDMRGLAQGDATPLSRLEEAA